MTASTSEPTVLLGLEYPVDTGVVDPDGTIAYARAVDDPNPEHLDGTAAPPLYTVSLMFPMWIQANAGMVEPGAVENVRGGVHAEHDVVFHEPVVPGATIQWTSTGYAVRPTRAGVLASMYTLISDEQGAPLMEHWWSSLFIGGTLAPHLDPAGYGPDLADHTFPEEARTRPFGSYQFTIAPDQSFRYAGASGDRSPIHVSDEPARAQGFPSKFLQGMCTLAMASGAVVKLGADGDVARLRRLATRFASPVFPRSDLVVELYDGGTNEVGDHVLVFEATALGQTVLKHGRAEIRPA